MPHLSEQFLNSTLKITPNENYKEVIAYLIYLTDELTPYAEKSVASGNSGLMSFINGIEIETNFQYVEVSDLKDKFGHIDFHELAKSQISYCIKGEYGKSVFMNVFGGNSIGEYEFGFDLNLSGLKEAVKDYEFYAPRRRFVVDI